MVTFLSTVYLSKVTIIVPGQPRNALFVPQLSEVFEQEIDPVMQSLGYCCGRKYTFNPQVLCCYGKQLCTIPRDAKYFSYQNR